MGNISREEHAAMAIMRNIPRIVSGSGGGCPGDDVFGNRDVGGRYAVVGDNDGGGAGGGRLV